MSRFISCSLMTNRIKSRPLKLASKVGLDYLIIISKDISKESLR